MLYPIDLLAKKGKEKVSMLTAYDYSMASILDKTELDMVLVGDSLGNVILGHRDTIPVTVDDMIHHGKAVVKGAASKFVVIDMPFMSVSGDLGTAVENVRRVIQETGAHAVKIEGADFNCDVIKRLTASGVAVMGHLGLTPQSYITLGGHKKQGKTEEAHKKILADAKKLQESGVFAIVFECITDALAKDLTESLSILTIGIGAGKNCDGQVLVINDLIGLTESRVPSFVVQKCNIALDIKTAVKGFIQDAKS
jgi:3-methyl-2-oxobutanoate hydroxymethyltransferase